MPINFEIFEPPPFQRPLESETSSAEADLTTLFSSATSLELCVRGLDRSSHDAAVEHLNALLAELREEEEGIPDLMVRGQHGNLDHNLDFAFVTLGPPFNATPRPDILDYIKEALNDRFGSRGVVADWKIGPRTRCSGWDRTRTVVFTMQDYTGLPAAEKGKVLDRFKEGIDRHFLANQLIVQAYWHALDSGHVTYIFTNHDALARLDEVGYPTIEECKYDVEANRFHPITYGLEIVVTNLGVFEDSMEELLNEHFQRQYGPLINGEQVVRQSRLLYQEEGGTCYAAVLYSPEIAARAVAEPVAASAAFHSTTPFPLSPPPNGPFYLYEYNSCGCDVNLLLGPLSPSEISYFRQQQLEQDRKTDECLAKLSSAIASLAAQASTLSQAVLQLQLQYQPVQVDAFDVGVLHFPN